MESLGLAMDLKDHAPQMQLSADGRTISSLCPGGELILNTDDFVQKSSYERLEKRQ